ncbi:DUF1080 domain-containing protein [Pedobacter sp. JCM 36344]|uniref:3-keto-disaccharide hydrolase n=1 Tax=Pedobacter sp. JCM 36344 TaxID=3374280 RepID=UPI00397CEDF1
MLVNQVTSGVNEFIANFLTLVNHMKQILLLLTLFPCVFVNAQINKIKPIFNGKDLEGWTKFLQKQGVNRDPQNVFKIEDGVLHVSGQDFGYIATKKSYKNFHLSLEFKWGEKKYPPREHDKRDAGVCYNVEILKDKIWPKSVECQIQEGDVGDLWLVDSVTAFVDGIKTEPKDYATVMKIRDGERSHGEWNKVEIISKNGKFNFIVNGVLVNEGEYVSLNSGRILLQSEGAEIFYRDIKIEEYPDLVIN